MKTRQIPQLVGQGTPQSHSGRSRTGRYAWRFAGRYSYFDQDDRNMNKRADPKMHYFPIGSFSMHWKPWMILMMSDPRDFYDNAKEALIGSCFPLVCMVRKHRSSSARISAKIEVLFFFCMRFERTDIGLNLLYHSFPLSG